MIRHGKTKRLKKKALDIFCDISYNVLNIMTEKYCNDDYNRVFKCILGGF